MNAGRWVLIGAAVVFFWFLGGHDLWAPDEPFFAEGAREMVVDGKWLVPHVNGVVNNHKPPLFFWLVAVFSLPLGAVTEFTARLPSALAAIGTLTLTMRLGRRWFGPKTAAVAGVVLATSYMFWDKARWSQIDSLLCLLIWVSLSAFEAYMAGDAGGRGAGALFWFAAGLAVLAKGPVGMLLPVGVVVIVLALERDLGSLRGFAPILGPLIFILTTGSWAVAASLWGPAEYSVVASLHEHFVERGLHGMHHAQPFWYFAERLPLSLLPWTGLFPGAVVVAWRLRRRSPGLRLALVAAVFVVVFFSISTEKRDLYVLPAFPAVALMMAALVAVVVGWKDEVHRSMSMDRRWITVGQAVVGLLCVVVAVAAPIARQRVDIVPGWMIALLAVTLLVSGVATLVFAVRGLSLASVVATAGGIAAAYLVVTALVYPAMEPRKSARSFARLIDHATVESRAAGHEVLAWRAGNVPRAFAFYTDGLYTVETEDPEVLADHLRQGELVYAVVDADELDEVPKDVVAGMAVIAEARLSRMNLLLVANQSIPSGGTI